MKIPRQATEYILFQRTGYIKCRRLEKLIGLNKLVRLQTPFIHTRVQTLYNYDMKKEFDSMTEYLPTNIKTILDIGCGVAGIDVLLHTVSGAEIYLIDKSQVDKKVFYFFEKRGSFYNSLSVAKELLNQNGVKNVFLQEATENNEIKFKKKFDLIISLLSWGFHYPIETYLESVYEHMNFGASLIVDVRKETGGLELLTKKFKMVNIIYNGRKHVRIIAIK